MFFIFLWSKYICLIVVFLVEIERTIVSSGGITAILKALDTFATDSTIQEAGCIALHNLCAKSGSLLLLCTPF